MHASHRECSEPLGITVVMPALNEEANIGAAVCDTLRAFDSFGLDGEVVIVNDGSTDGTAAVVRTLMAEDARVRTIAHDEPHGIGASFWDGVDQAAKEAVVMLPGDNENDPRECFRYTGLLADVDIIIPFVLNHGARSATRKIVSFAYQFIINLSFGTSFNYTNGTVIYRRCVLSEITQRSTGFFFQTDILVRAVKMRRYLFAEVPYRVRQRTGGHSKAISFRTFGRVSRDYVRLFCAYYFSRACYSGLGYPEGTATALRSDSGNVQAARDTVRLRN